MHSVIVPPSQILLFQTPLQRLNSVHLVLVVRLQFTVKHQASQALGIQNGTIQTALLYGDINTVPQLIWLIKAILIQAIAYVAKRVWRVSTLMLILYVFVVT